VIHTRVRALNERGMHDSRHVFTNAVRYEDRGAGSTP
jgi:hypothetical protein